MFATFVQHWGYKNIAKPVFFRFDAEAVHNRMVSVGETLGGHPVFRRATQAVFAYQHPALRQTVAGIRFDNPVGLSAGFDYEARLINILPSVGFGFHTVGTVTNEPYEGNLRPRLGRLPKSRSLLVNKGFKSAGMKAGLERIAASHKTIPLGMSIGSTNTSYPSFADQIQDVVQGFRQAIQADLVDYYELNISCPNLANIQEGT